MCLGEGHLIPSGKFWKILEMQQLRLAFFHFETLRVCSTSPFQILHVVNGYIDAPSVSTL